MRQKIKDLTAILLIQLILTLPFYTASVYGLTISNVRVTKVTSNSAAIEWLTDDASNGKVKYGKTTSLGFSERHENFVDNHSLNIVNGIDSGTTYFFSVESSGLDGNTAVDNNSNSFYTFKTADITPPPQVTGLQAASKTSNSIFLSWNSLDTTDLSHYIIYRNRVAVGNSMANSFNDTGVSSGSLSYKVSAVDTSGNEGVSSDTIIVSALPFDAAAPIISNVDAISITDTTARITWLTDENSTTIALYGINKTDKTKSSTELVINHTIMIDGLVKNVKYTALVKSCDANNNCANLSKNFTAVKDIKPPFINLSTSGFVNRRVVDLIGSTEPFSQITLFVNNMNIPKRSLSNAEIGNSGKFAFSQVQLEQDNLIKLVAVDKSGNRNQKIFEISVDTQGPVVQLDELPSLTSKINLTVKGSVNEQVLINVFVDAKANESAMPSQITGLNVTKVGQNFVELHWGESKDKDFSHYVVYREDASPIATTKPANFNLYIDALVESGRSYTYQVSAVNIFANEGPKSEQVIVTTLSGGAALGIKPQDVDIFEDFRKPLMILNGSGSFNFGIKLNKGDGDYFIKLIFEDRAKNSVVIEKNVILDTKKPEVKIISPPSGALVFENVANEVDIIGRTKPNARVHLFIDRTPFSGFNASLELSGLPNEIQNIAEGELDAKCRLNIGSRSFCRTGADFSETADENGNFKFKNVDLTASFGGAARLREVPATEFRDERLEEGKDAKTTTLVVIATDATGQRGFATQRVNIGTCWSGNQSWDVIPLTRFQSPTFLSTERMAEGTETIYFYFNYSYIGRGTSPIITGISLSKACGTRELLDPRFNISCQVMPSGVPTKHLKLSKNEIDNTVSYSAAQLARFPGMDGFLEKDWKRFLNAINKELTFPMRVRITYKHDTDNDGQLETETQQTCEQVSYAVDSTIIDPRKFMPDWLLFDFVNFLQDSIKSLTKLQEQIDRLVDFVAVGCLASGGVNLAVQVFRRWTEFWEEKTFIAFNSKNIEKLSELIGIGKITLKTEKKEYEQDCQDTIAKIVKKYGAFKLKYVNDIDLKRCFPASAGWWATEASTYQWMRYSCDRIFGHAAPSKWTETKVDGELSRRIQGIEGCPIDESERGQPLRAEKCVDILSLCPQCNKENYKPDDICFRVSTRRATGKGGVALVKRGALEEGDVYKIEKPVEFSEVEISYAVKKDDFNYIANQPQSCQEICDGGKKGKKATVKIDGKNVQIVEDAKGTGAVGKCLTVPDCRVLNVKDNQDKIQITYEKDGKTERDKPLKFARTWGYTTDCFYNPNSDFSSIDVVSKNPATRVECCCLSFTDSKTPSTNFYQPDDKDPADPEKFVHESKSTSGKEPQGQLLSSNEAKDDLRFADMKWSYRYWKERFIALGAEDGKTHNEYNKNRYIEERDLPACFGQNHWVYDNPTGIALGEPERVLTVDPFKDHVAAIQCAHLAGISNRIQFLKNLMTSLSTCLIQVRTTGKGDSGACKELFTQYLCNAIWQVVKLITNKGCVGYEPPPDFDVQSENVIESVKAGFKSVSDSISDFQTSITREYGNAKLNEILGTGEESIARKVCLGAFGYDWEINVKNIVDAAYTSPFATLVQAITRSREFLTVDPVSLKPKYEYRASWIINPGCDFERYDVYLACVGRKQLDLYPNQINCGAVGAPSIGYTGQAPFTSPSVGYSQCDCIGLPDEKIRPILGGRRLKQNILEDTSIPSNNRVVEDNYRYDHLKFVLRADRKIQANVKPNCFPTGYDDGTFYFPITDRTARDVFDCRADSLSGTLTGCCRVDSASGALVCGGGAVFGRGTAEFIDIKIDNQNALGREELAFFAGEPLNIDVTVRNVGQNKCLIAKFDDKTYVEMVTEGINQYPIRTDAITLSTRPELTANGIEVRKVNLANQNDESITVKFIDYDDHLDNSITLGQGKDKIEIAGQAMSMDEIKSLLNSRVKLGTGTSAVEVSIENGELMLNKNGAKVAVISAPVQRNPNDGQVRKDESEKHKINSVASRAYAEGTIRIGRPIDTLLPTQLPQQLGKQLLIGLYHTRDELGTGIESCNQNEAVLTASGTPQQRNIRILVQQKPTSQQLPLIRPPKYLPSPPFKKDQISLITITSTVFHRDGISSAELNCKSPDGKSINLVRGNPTKNNEYEFDINPSNLGIAGKYTCQLKATANNKQSHQEEVSFEVQCGPENGVYGSCKRCPSENAISGGLKCYRQDILEEGGDDDNAQLCCR